MLATLTVLLRLADELGTPAAGAAIFRLDEVSAVEALRGASIEVG